MVRKKGQTPPDVEAAMVVLDTNVLDQTALLKDPLFVSMLFYLGQVNGCLGLPEIVRREWENHFVKHCRRLVNEVEQKVRWLDGMIGGMPSVDVDVEASARGAFQDRLDELGELLVELPIEPGHWQTAGEMVIAKRAPSTEGSQQFKDSLLWRVLLEAGQSQTVILITEDKGFLATSKDSLTPSLQEEASEHNAKIHVFTSIRPLLEKLRDESSTFVESLDDRWDEIEDQFTQTVNAELESFNWEMVGEGTWAYEVFASGTPQMAVVSIELEHQLVPVDDPDVDIPAYVEVKGSALVDTKSWDIEVEIDSALVTVYTPHDEIVTRVAEPAAPRRSLIRSKLDMTL